MSEYENGENEKLLNVENNFENDIINEYNIEKYKDMDFYKNFDKTDEIIKEDLENMEIKMEDFILIRIKNNISILEVLLFNLKSNLSVIRKDNYSFLTSNDSSEIDNIFSYIFLLENFIIMLSIELIEYKKALEWTYISRKRVLCIFERDYSNIIVCFKNKFDNYILFMNKLKNNDLPKNKLNYSFYDYFKFI
jgi:hypothetical protein